MNLIEQKTGIIECYQSGQSAWEVASRLGLSHSTVYRVLQKQGISRTQSQAQHLRHDKGYKANRNEDGRTKSGEYIVVLKPEHPRALKSGYVHESILIWEQVHKKALPKGWVVHHLNGIKNDNRPCNLMAMPSYKHYQILTAKAQRIRELEAEVGLLQKVLNDSQMIFRLGEN